VNGERPFWIIYWHGNEVWRIDDQGKERQLLLDWSARRYIARWSKDCSGGRGQDQRREGRPIHIQYLSV